MLVEELSPRIKDILEHHTVCGNCKSAGRFTAVDGHDKPGFAIRLNCDRCNRVTWASSKRIAKIELGFSFTDMLDEHSI